MDSVMVETEAASGEIDMTWRASSAGIASFAPGRVFGIWVKGAPGEEFLTAKLSQKGNCDSIFWLKPAVRVKWGNVCHR